MWDSIKRFGFLSSSPSPPEREGEGERGNGKSFGLFDTGKIRKKGRPKDHSKHYIVDVVIVTVAKHFYLTFTGFSSCQVLNPQLKTDFPQLNCSLICKYN